MSIISLNELNIPMARQRFFMLNCKTFLNLYIFLIKETSEVQVPKAVENKNWKFENRHIILTLNQNIHSHVDKFECKKIKRYK